MKIVCPPGYHDDDFVATFRTCNIGKVNLFNKNLFNAAKYRYFNQVKYIFSFTF